MAAGLADCGSATAWAQSRAVILVWLEYDGGVAVISRDGHGAWLRAGDGDDAARLGGTLLDSRLARVGVGAGRVVVGGLLPSGASRAFVDGLRATTGNGGWIAVIDSRTMAPEIAARFEADDGTIVRPALPDRWTREPVTDADEPCPACGALAWERVTPTDGSRGTSGPSGGRMRPTAVIVCTRCGHEVNEGGWYGPGVSTRVRWSPWRALAHVWNGGRSPHRVRDPVLDDLGFPVYALADAEAELAGHGWDRRYGVHSATTSHEGVDITTRVRSHAPAEADHEIALALSSVIERAEPLTWGPGSNAARALRIRAHRRAVSLRVDRAEPWQVELPVDGTPVRFTGLRDPAGWAAAGETTRARIVIGASRIEPEDMVLRRL